MLACCVSKAGRAPMFVFTFERALLRFTVETPALTPLFQLPPRIGVRFIAVKPSDNLPV